VSDSSVARDAAPLSDASATDLIGELNEHVAELVGKVETLVAEPTATATATEEVWNGTEGGVSDRFTMTRGGPNRFAWLLQAQAGGHFVQVLAGGIRRGAVAHRGTGFFALDYDNYAAAAAGTATVVAARGRFGAVFAHGPNGILLEYALKNYSGAGEAPHSAFFHAVRVSETALHPALAFFRAGGRRDLVSGPVGQESVIVRERRAAGIGGWARGVVFGGDVPLGEAFLFRECWSPTKVVAYRRVWLCATDAAGQTSTCRYESTGAFAQLGVLTGSILPAAGGSSDPNGAAEKETFRQLCLGGLAPGLAAAALAEPDPPADENDTTEDVSLAGAPADATPTTTDTIDAALAADGTPPSASP
jgi:hypothetical protein